MRFTKKYAIAILVLALALLSIQAVLWARADSSPSETQNIDRIGKHPPSEVAGLAGLCLLVLDGVLLSIPRRVHRN